MFGSSNHASEFQISNQQSRWRWRWSQPIKERREKETIAIELHLLDLLATITYKANIIAIDRRIQPNLKKSGVDGDCRQPIDLSIVSISNGMVSGGN
jgi:hypothetical protein